MLRSNRCRTQRPLAQVRLYCHWSACKVLSIGGVVIEFPVRLHCVCSSCCSGPVVMAQITPLAMTTCCLVSTVLPLNIVQTRRMSAAWHLLWVILVCLVPIGIEEHTQHRVQNKGPFVEWHRAAMHWWPAMGTDQAHTRHFEWFH